MWRETVIFGIYLSPLPAYALVAFLLTALLARLLLRRPVAAWLPNPALVQVSLFLGLLAALVTWL